MKTQQIKTLLNLITRQFERDNDAKTLANKIKTIDFVDLKNDSDKEIVKQFYQYANATLNCKTCYNLAYKLAIAYYKMRVTKIGILNDFNTLNCLYFAYSVYKKSLLERNKNNYDLIEKSKHIDILSQYNCYDIVSDFLMFIYASNIQDLQASKTLEEYTIQYEILFKNVMRLQAKKHYIDKNGAYINKQVNSEYTTPKATIEYIWKSLLNINIKINSATRNNLYTILSKTQKELTKKDKDYINRLVKSIENAITNE